MTEKHDMQWALGLAIKALNDCACDGVYNVSERQQFENASDMLKNGGPVVEHSEKTDPSFKCNNCGLTTFERHGVQAFSCNCWTENGYVRIEREKRWTEREKIQIVPEKSAPIFEEIE